MCTIRIHQTICSTYLCYWWMPRFFYYVNIDLYHLMRNFYPFKLMLTFSPLFNRAHEFKQMLLLKICTKSTMKQFMRMVSMSLRPSRLLKMDTTIGLLGIHLELLSPRKHIMPLSKDLFQNTHGTFGRFQRFCLWL